jgi:hypothetical protein
MSRRKSPCRIITALCATFSLATSSLPTHGATYVRNLPECTALSLAGSTVYCDGNSLFTLAGVDCPRLALGRQGDDYTLVCATPNHTGLWWNPAESGWGMSVAHQGDIVFAVWFVYGATGAPLWLAMTGHKDAVGQYVGNVYMTTGPSFAAFDAAQVRLHPIDEGVLTPVDSETLEFRLGNVIKRLTRQTFGPLPTCNFGTVPDQRSATNYTDLWWNPNESGWGVGLTHQGDTLFAAWFTYDLDGTPLWLVATLPRAAADVFTGMLYQTAGPAFATPFDPMKVTTTPTGTATLTFANGNAATLAYTVNRTSGNVTQSKPITRQVFVGPGAVCG